MNPPDHSSRTTWFLIIAGVVWLVLVHGIAFIAFGLTFMAASVIAGALFATFCGIVAYLAWEFRHAKSMPTRYTATPAQDVNLLMLSRPLHPDRSVSHRRTRVRLYGHNPTTDRIAALHRPPHFDRRIGISKSRPSVVMSPMLDFADRKGKVTPSAN